MNSNFKRLFTTFASLLFVIISDAQTFEMMHLYYGSDSSALSNDSKQRLDSVVEYYSNRRIIIEGHSDYKEAENNTIFTSSKRANIALRYLVDKGFPETQIIYVRGVGKPNETLHSKGISSATLQNSRVDIYITKGRSIIAKKNIIPTIVIPLDSVAEHITFIDYDSLVVGDVIALKNIMFEPGTDNLELGAFAEFDNLYTLLVAHPTLKIGLEGHICCSKYPDGFLENAGSWKLSVKRAKMVETLLIAKGIAFGRLSYKGFGHTKPIFEKETTHAEEQANRRVEIRILEK